MRHGTMEHGRNHVLGRERAETGDLPIDREPNSYYGECDFSATATGSNYYFGGKLLKNPSGWVYPDRVGSIGKFFPYGIERTSPPTSNGTEKFTSYFRDSETGNDYAVNRYMSPGFGMFITPDPASHPKIADPGSWNMYAYTRGDPINRVDRAGTDDDDPDCVGDMCQLIDDGYGGDGDDGFENACIASLLEADGLENPTAAANTCGALDDSDPTPSTPSPNDPVTNSPTTDPATTDPTSFQPGATTVPTALPPLIITIPEVPPLIPVLIGILGGWVLGGVSTPVTPGSNTLGGPKPTKKPCSTDPGGEGVCKELYDADVAACNAKYKSDPDFLSECLREAYTNYLACLLGKPPVASKPPNCTGALLDPQAAPFGARERRTAERGAYS